MNSIAQPDPIIKARAVDPNLEQQALASGLDPVLARIIAARPIATTEAALTAVRPGLKLLAQPDLLADANKAVQRIIHAITNNEIIALETDHDCDGQTSHAVLYTALNQYFGLPKDRIQSYIGHRLQEGYGLSQALAERILAAEPRPNLVITADNGSSDEARIALLKAAGIDVIVTDHHGIPAEGVPKSAFACINPTRSDCDYPDPMIAGCMVAWLLMAATRKELINQKILPTTAPSLAEILDFVAVGTVADCVSMAQSINNRAVVRFGLQLINQQGRPCWRALNKLASGKISSETLAFTLGPLLNADGRLSSAFGSVSFLLADSDAEASSWLQALGEQNQERKAIQKDLVDEGKKLASEQFLAGKQSLCIYIEDGHSGVHGIAASKIREAYGRPTVYLAPKATDPELLTGSMRGTEDFHVREAMAEIAANDPDILISFGGHKGAGGLALKRENLAKFEQAFEAAVIKQLGSDSLQPIIWTDGELDPTQCNLTQVAAFNQLEPFGREFDQPIFELTAVCKAVRWVGADHNHAQITLQLSTGTYRAIYFSPPQSVAELGNDIIEQRVKVVLSMKQNFYQGIEQLNLQLHWLELDN